MTTSKLRKITAIITIMFLIVINLMDFYLTKIFWESGVLIESNPFVLKILPFGFYVLFIIKKITIVPMCFAIWKLRNHFYFRYLFWFCNIIMILLSFWWVLYIHNDIELYKTLDIRGIEIEQRQK